MDQNAARAVLQEAFPNNHQEVEEYIREAEDQDGPTYWAEKVRSAQALIDDMHLYLDALEIKMGASPPEVGEGGNSDG